MNLDHGGLALSSTRLRLSVLPTVSALTALAVLALLTGTGPLWLAGAAVCIALQVERVNVRLDPEWLVLQRRRPWFVPSPHERYSVASIARAALEMGGDGQWFVRVWMRSTIGPEALAFPVRDRESGRAIADALSREAEASRDRADPAAVRSKIDVPRTLTEMMRRRE